METIVMSSKEVSRLEALQRYAAGGVTQEQLARRLRLSRRQTKRLWQAYREGGAAALASRRRGRPSNRRLPPELLDAALRLVQERYVGFGPTFASEQLAQHNGLQLSRETLRKAMIANGLWKAGGKGRHRVHQPRERRSARGELVQGDGSPHAWFEKRAPRCTLLLLIDDATSAIGAALFAPSESTDTYFALFNQYLSAHGRPLALYVDHSSVFTVTRPTDRDDLTQFARAMRELDVEIICANSPQAKGRVERANRTLQDRLVKELRLRQISTIEAANAFLPAFVADYNVRFAIPPADPVDAHRPLLEAHRLDDILCHCETRRIRKDLTFRYGAALYAIENEPEVRRLRYRQVLVRERDGRIRVELDGRTLAFHATPLAQRPTVDSKDLNAAVDRTRLGPRQPDPKKQRKPAPDHIWRRGYPRPLAS